MEALEVYEPAVAEEEALPEPEAAPAPKGENAYLSVCLSQCFASSCIGLVCTIADYILLLIESSKNDVLACCFSPCVLC